MKYLVAVYGTLKQNESNHHLLLNSILAYKGETLPHYDMYDLGGFPGGTTGTEKLRVEVYIVDDETLLRLDRLEVHPSFFKRELTIIHLDDGEVAEAWMYTVGNYTGQTKYLPAKYLVKDDKGRLDWSR